MRQIILDTETTGLSPQDGHRIIEIGAIELVDRRFTKHDYHCYINPGREVEAGAVAIHGITNEFLRDKPSFKEIADEFLRYISGAELVIHNAPFDVGFLNYEYRLLNPRAKLISDVAEVFDTLALARKKHPGKKNSLDALCRRYDIDNSKREFHGALLDAQLLAEVYLAMTGGQMQLFGDDVVVGGRSKKTTTLQKLTHRKESIIINASTDELRQHKERLEAIKNASGGACVWNEDSAVN